MRKSSKIKDIVESYGKRLKGIKEPYDFVNYTYFLAKINDFDLVSKIDSKERGTFIYRGIQSSIDNIHNLKVEDAFKHFRDVTIFDPAIGFSAKLTEFIKDPERQIETRQIFKLIKSL